MAAGGNGKGKGQGKPPVPPGQNQAPTAIADFASVQEDTVFAALGNLLANDTDPNVGDVLTVTTVGTFIGLYGTLVINADGSYSYSLNNGAAQGLGQTQSAAEQFAYTMRDAAGKLSSSAITVTITGLNDDAAISGPATGAVTEDGAPQSASATLSIVDVDSGEARFQTPTLLAGTYGNFSFDPSSGAWSYTLNNSAANVQALTGVDTVQDTLTVLSVDGTASQDIVVTVHGTDEGPPPADRLTRVSLGTSGESTGPSGALGSGFPIIFGDGRYVAFYSEATNLVLGDTNGKADFFIYDRTSGVTERIPAGINAPSDGAILSASDDGRYFAFNSLSDTLVPGDTNGTSDIFIYDRQTQSYERIDGNGYSSGAQISGDGRFVSFHSHASNLVPGDTNGVPDAFIYDRVTHTTERILGLGGAQDNSGATPTDISPDGRYTVFYSNFGGFVAGDNNGTSDTFVYDRDAGSVQRVSVSTTGGDGNSGSESASITPDGRFVAFSSTASNLVGDDNNGQRDIFVRDMLNGTTERVSVTSSGGELNGVSHLPSISDDGRYVAFHSLATNGGGDTNGTEDVFVYDRVADTLRELSVNDSLVPGNGQSAMATVSGDGQSVVFASYASNLVAADQNGLQDVFLANLSAGGFLVI